ncbi:MAG: 2-hydroxyacid dehydrogenase [Geminicoccaceae bacterium]
MSVEIAAVSAFPPAIIGEMEKYFTVHCVWDQADKVEAVRPLGGRIRGVASGGMVGLSRAMMEALPNLEICAINGVGLETTDLAFAKERKVTVATAPLLFDEVADLAMLLALAACRKLPVADRFVREGKWPQGQFPLETKFSGKRMGILGLGRIGIALARRLEGFTDRIAYYDPVPKSGISYAAAASAMDLARESDVLFMAAAGGPAGSGDKPVSRELLEALGPTGVFVNVARGWLVDEPAMIELLQNGGLGAAGLDVFENEPHVPEAMYALDNVVLTPHVASSTVETRRAMGMCVVDNLRSWFEGKGALTAVN